MLETLEQTDLLNGPKLAAEVYDRQALEDEAWGLIAGHQRIEHDSWPQEPEINARTALFEELTAKGHLSRIEFSEHPDIVNQRTLQRLLNAWSENLPYWEKQRRFHEIVEELINHRVWDSIKDGLLPEDMLVITHSNFPSTAPEHQATAMGYGVINRKGMVRATSFEGGKRVMEQVSRSNSDDGSAELFFMSNGLEVEPGATQILSHQVLGDRRAFPDGVVDVQRALDNLAGPNIIYGENKLEAGLSVPAYEDLRQVSAAREEQAETFIRQLADFERQLDTEYKKGLMSYEQKLSQINRVRKDIVNQICLIDPSYASDARGADTVEYFEQASLAMAAGDDAVGVQHFESALAAADHRAGAVCGGSGLTAAEIVQKSEAGRLFQEAKAERKNWKWKKGVCLVKECPSRPAKTEVGPCSVCRKCQTIFDKGDNPKSVYKTTGFLEMLFNALAEQQPKKPGKDTELKSQKN